jgi:hypothetical protein
MIESHDDVYEEALELIEKIDNREENKDRRFMCLVSVKLMPEENGISFDCTFDNINTDMFYQLAMSMNSEEELKEAFVIAVKEGLDARFAKSKQLRNKTIN